MNAAAVSIEAMTEAHADGVRHVYAEGIATGNATFETEAPSWEAWDKAHRADCRFVALSVGGEVLGWAALSRVSERCVYGGVAEVSVYVAGRARNLGLGTRLLSRLIEGSEAADVWTLQAGIFPENTASIALHERCGFRVVGVREKLGRLRGAWRDVALLERRSKTGGA